MTAQFVIKAEPGNRVKIRALLDTGSSATLLTNRVATQLGLSKTKLMTRITSIQGNKAKPSHHIVRFAAESLDLQEQTVTITPVLVDKITHDLHTASIS